MTIKRLGIKPVPQRDGTFVLNYRTVTGTSHSPLYHLDSSLYPDVVCADAEDAMSTIALMNVDCVCAMGYLESEIGRRRLKQYIKALGLESLNY